MMILGSIGFSGSGSAVSFRLLRAPSFPLFFVGTYRDSLGGIIVFCCF